MASLAQGTGALGVERGQVSELIEIVAASDHPGPVELYAAAARKSRSDFEGYPELDQALVLACEMSEVLTEGIVRLGQAGRCDEPWLRWLSDGLQAREPGHAAPAPRTTRGRASRTHDRRRASAEARRLLPEEVKAWPQPGGQRPGWAVVDWGGTRVAIEAAGSELLARAGGRSSVDPESFVHEVRREVFSASAQRPHSVHTLALYAYQTLIVHRPEAYARAAVWSRAATILARHVRAPEGLLAWMRRHVEPGSIFPEDHRVMLPDQVTTHGVGRPLDKALLLFAVARQQGLGARVVQTTQGAYALVTTPAGTTIIDAQTLRAVSRPRGVVVLAFDEDRQFGFREAWTPPEPTLDAGVLSPQPRRLAGRRLAGVSVA